MYTAVRASLVSTAGIQKGDKVAIVSKNRVEWAAVAAACYSLGCPVVPLYENQVR
jgi:long-chain acyl-CoA synthetase